jgi:DNA polymerase III alpha subunit
MNSARGDKVKFGSVDINRLATNFQGNSVKGKEKVTLGLVSLKNVGDSLCKQFTDDGTDETHSYASIDEFIEKKGKNKTLLERLIKLGAFQHIHPNIFATWEYYRYKHCSGKEITALRKKIRALLLKKEGWDDLAVVEEVKRQSVAYRTLYPNRTRIPPKILNWKPKPIDNYEAVMGLFDTDYELDAILEYEKQYLGYYWHSPADLYKTSGRATIDMAKQTGVLQGVITDLVQAKTRNGHDMYKLFVNDGNSECLLILWDSDMPQPAGLMKIDVGIEAQVKYDEKRGSFTLQRGTRLAKLWSKKGWEEEKTKGYEEENI